MIKQGRPGVDKRRLETIRLMVNSGMNYTEIAKSLGRSKQIVRYWAKLIHNYNLPLLEQKK